MTSVSSGPIPLDLDAMDAMNRQSLGHSASPAQESPNMRGSISTDFFKFFSGGGGGNQNKKTTRDGQPAKRRGPKPDSKPALTRRQELNRQAQRTHRERKEQYIRALESEVARLREAYTQEISAANLAVHQHREMISSVSEENNMLKEILATHNISFEAELERRKAERPMPGFQSSPVAPGSVGSQTGMTSMTAHTYSTPPTTVSSGMSPKANGVEKIDFSSAPDVGSNSQAVAAMPCDALAAIDRRPAGGGGGVFEDNPQLQVDFILALESPCREHTDYLCRRSITEAEDEDMPFSGHALMATCPPPSYIANTTNEQVYPHKTYDLPHANLSTLLNLSRQLVTEGQVTPIMALQALKSHDMYTRLTRDDVKLIMDTLENKVRCYGFGAVVEDFELMDCFSNVLGSKFEGAFSQPIDEMYS